MAKRNLLIIGHTWPEPKATAAGVRMMQLIQYFKDAGWEITFACASVKSENAADLSSLEIKFMPIAVNDDSFDSFVKSLNPEIVVFDRYITEEQFGWRVAENVPECIRILDTEDLHSLRMAREQAVNRNKTFKLNDWLQLDQTKRELASIYRCDLSLIISRYEIQLLEQELGIPSALLFYLPIWTDTDYEYLRGNLGYKDREGFIFIGNGKHKPNIDAIHHLYKTIWPAIRKLMPNARMDIYGAYLPDNLRSLDDPKKGFHVKGYIADAHKAIQEARINLVPLRFGAGLKGKILMALENGTPNITTSFGAEGILDSNNEFVIDKAEDLASAAVRLYKNDKEWLRQQDRGYEILKERFSGDQYKEAFSKEISRLSECLEEHRSGNFVGLMLQHHSMQSTKYLSKWITLKNRLKIRDHKS